MTGGDRVRADTPSGLRCPGAHAPRGAFLSPGPKAIAFARHERPAKQWSSRSTKLGVLVNDACDTCNGGWMSALENRTKPILGAMIAGNVTTVDVVQQRIIAQWAHKTAMVFDLLTRSGGSPVLWL